MAVAPGPKGLDNDVTELVESAADADVLLEMANTAALEAELIGA